MFNHSNSSLNFNNGLAHVTPGVYFNGDFTISAWVKVNLVTRNSILLSFGNEIFANGVILCLSSFSTGLPFLQLNTNGTKTEIISNQQLQIGKWEFLTAVLNGTNAYLYINATQVAYNTEMIPPLNVFRKFCNFGANSANVDDIMVFNRSLDKEQIKNLMTNVLF